MPPLVVLIAAASLGASLGGCATAIPLPSLLGDGDVTGSIAKPVSPLSSSLDAEDWRRAQGALAIALDPQGNGLSVAWDNPKSGAKGNFVPVGDAYAKDDRICRAFIADVGGTAPQQAVQGTGCRAKSGDWAVADIKPWKKA